MHGDVRAAGRAVAGEEVDDARREASLTDEVHHHERGDRGLLARLHDDGAAAADGGRDLPGLHHHAAHTQDRGDAG